MPLAVFNLTVDDDAVSVSEDGLTAYLSSGRPSGAGSEDIYIAQRTAVTAEFGAPVLLEGVNTAASERQPIVSRDGLRLFFFTDRVAASLQDFYVASRSTTVATFGGAAPVAGLNSTAEDASWSFSGDETLVYFASERAGGAGSYDIYVADFGSNGASNVRLVAELNSPALDAWPAVSRDGLTIYFASTRTTAGGDGNGDIWVALRSTTSDGFGTPQIVTELNSPAGESPVWLSPDGCTVYFLSTRDSGDGGHTGSDLYQATRGQ